MAENFSDRYGYRRADAEITIREDAPDGLRFAVLAIAKKAGLGPTSMREIILPGASRTARSQQLVGLPKYLGGGPMAYPKVPLAQGL